MIGGYKDRVTCRSCAGHVTEVLDLGKTPLADALLDEQTPAEEAIIPLHVLLCNECKLLQIREDVEPAILFDRNYPYFSSVNLALKEHFHTSARHLISKYQLAGHSFVIELASNDGVMLEVFRDAGIKTLGIDPAEGPSRVAKEKGIDVMVDFFDLSLSKSISTKYPKADLILGNNVLAHVPDPNTVLSGIAHLLQPEGKAVIEVPYAGDMIEKTEFDTIFHQHYSYFSLTALLPLFERNSLYISEVERIPIHGGSLRLTAGLKAGSDPSVVSLLEEEKRRGLDGMTIYQRFAENVKKVKAELLALLDDLKAKGKTIQAYGAAGKANTLMSYIGIGNNYVDYIADISVYKQGKYFPGNHLPIVPPEKIVGDRPDYVLILAWNFADSIMAQLNEYRQQGGQFIIPIPTPHVC